MKGKKAFMIFWSQVWMWSKAMKPVKTHGKTLSAGAHPLQDGWNGV
jgi:hypothetical protein